MRSGFKRSLLGYRPRDVKAALDARDSALAESGRSLAAAASEGERFRTRVAQLELAADRLSDRVVSGERELEATRAELERLREQGERPLHALVALADEIDGIRRQARGQATRMRMLALREAAELSGRLAELARGPEETRERLLEAIGEALAGIGGIREPARAPAEPEMPVNGAVNGSAARIAEDVFVGSVEVEVGPLSDFAQLVGFEDAAGEIDATSEITVKRFAHGRATLSMRLGEPVELLRELEERAPFEFKVRDLRADRVVLDVDED